ncbi:MAG TPA: PAS domain-containing protein [Bacteroidia bacterium]
MNHHQLPNELASQLKSFDGTMASLDNFIKEVSDRLKRKRELIAGFETRLRKLLEQSHDGVFLLDKEWKITNVTSLKNYGYADEELFSNAIQLGHPEEAGKMKEFVQDMFDSKGITKQITCRLQAKSGEWRWIRSNVTNLLDEPGIDALVFNYEDITEELKLKRERELERKNRDALINSTPDLMWSLDENMRLVTCNEAFRKRIKATTGMYIKGGQMLIDRSRYSDDKLKKWEERYRRALGGEAFTVEDFYSNNSGVTWEETRLNPIYEEDMIIGVSCF